MVSALVLAIAMSTSVARRMQWLALHPSHNLALPSNVWTDSTYVNRGPTPVS